MRPRSLVPLVAGAAIVAAAMTGCSAGTTSGVNGQGGANGKIQAVAAENQYGSVLAQLGGKYVQTTSILDNPNTDPHTFEASASVARTISQAGLIVQNGLGYDAFMNKLEAADGSRGQIVISAQKTLGLPDTTRNPHLWYSPKTMPAVAASIVKALTKLQPSHRAYFEANLARFTKSLAGWTTALAAFKAAHPNVSVATTEPVADYLLSAAGIKNRTPWALQAAIMNDTDPAPQDVATQDALLSKKRVEVFVYNEQVTDAITSNYLKVAAAHHIPVVGVYETMPSDGYTYQSWMEAEVKALTDAVTSGKSTGRL